MNKDYYCPICNWSPNIDEPSSAIEWEHCPNCLSLIHEESEDEQIRFNNKESQAITTRW